MPDERLQEIYRQVFSDCGLTPGDFGRIKIRTVYFKSFLRSAVVYPKHMLFYAGTDELFSGKKKLTLRFGLARGSYATMLIKRLFCT
jgi:tRNA pseudouridine13 synthase